MLIQNKFEIKTIDMSDYSSNTLFDLEVDIHNKIDCKELFILKNIGFLDSQTLFQSTHPILLDIKNKTTHLDREKEYFFVKNEDNTVSVIYTNKLTSELFAHLIPGFKFVENEYDEFVGNSASDNPELTDEVWSNILSTERFKRIQEYYALEYFYNHLNKNQSGFTKRIRDYSDGFEPIENNIIEINPKDSFTIKLSFDASISTSTMVDTNRIIEMLDISVCCEEREVGIGFSVIKENSNIKEDVVNIFFSVDLREEFLESKILKENTFRVITTPRFAQKNLNITMPEIELFYKTINNNIEVSSNAFEINNFNKLVF